jgi:hypothetical protein
MAKANKNTIAIIFFIISVYLLTLYVVFFFLKMDYFNNKLKCIESNVVGSRWVYHISK